MSVRSGEECQVIAFGLMFYSYAQMSRPKMVLCSFALVLIDPSVPLA